MLPLKKIICRIAGIFLLMSIGLPSLAQRVFVNTPNAIYEITGNVNNCNLQQLTNICLPDNGYPYSLAYRNNTFYILSGEGNKLYRVSMNAPGSCVFLTAFPSSISGSATTFNSLTIDRNGILYAADAASNRLYSYNPATNQQTLIGQLPVTPGGDLIFYYDKLLYAAMSGQLMEVNLADPYNSQPFMDTAPYIFYGIISFPSECKKNKIYGISSGGELVEIDMESRRVIGAACRTNLDLYDAASEVEDGNTVGVTISSIDVFASCNSIDGKGSATIDAHTIGSGSLTYTLDQSITNTTGNFSNLSIGEHFISISNSLGCVKDSSFMVKPGISSLVEILRKNPESCEVKNGSLTILAQSSYPLSYSLDGGPYQNSNTFNNLSGGIYHVRIKDEGHCERDTLITLTFANAPVHFSEIIIEPSFCTSKTGSIRVVSNVNAIQASLNNGPPTASLEFKSLDAGIYHLSVFKDPNCRIDTLIEIPLLEDPEPLVQLTTTDQFCFTNNGSITINASGSAPPYRYSLNNTNYTTNTYFANLAPAEYKVYAKNANNCLWIYPVTINPYLKKPFTYHVEMKPANCKEIKSGQVTVSVSGEEIPYTLRFRQQILPAVTTIEKLEPGKHTIAVLNKDGCEVGTIETEVGLTYSEECDKVMVPSAFTPNNDGINDLFIPIHSSYVRPTSFTIFNRYGQIVFQSKSGLGWDGRHKGNPLRTDVYVWTFYYENSRKEVLFMKGQVTLIR